MPSISARLTLLAQLFSLSLASNELFARQAVTSFSPAQTTACVNLAKDCFPTIASCTPAWCTSCAAVGGPDFVSCCSGTDAAGCISTLLATVGSTVDPNVAACDVAYELLESCASATPGFSTMLAGEQASCLCYTSSGTETVYAPRLYDNAQSGCVSWAKTADTSDYPGLVSAEGLCTAVGNVRSVNATTTATSAVASDSESSTSQAGSGGAVSTRTVSMTSTASSSGHTGSVVIVSTSTSSAAAAAALKQVQNYVEGRWGIGYLLLGLGWLV